MKEETRTYIINMISRNLRDMNRQIYSNTHQINKLAKENAILKRSRYELAKIIKQIKK